MREEVRQLWLDALRSGDYRQGTSYLSQPSQDAKGTDEYCCLGVLCDLAVKNNVIIDKVRNGDNDDGIYYEFTGVSGELPVEVRLWARLASPDPKVYLNDNRETLSTLNDDLKLTFDEIADVIQEQL